MKRPVSPEEEEETLETDADRARRTPLPSSAFRELLQASPSRRSTGARTATLTPTSSDVLPMRKGSLLSIRPSGTSRRPTGANGDQRSIAGSSKLTLSAEPSTSEAGPSRPTRMRAVIEIDEDSEEDDKSGNVTQRKEGRETRDSKPTLGPSAQVQPIVIDSDSDHLDILSSNYPSNRSIARPRKPRPAIRKCRGAPYIELPFIPLPRLKRFTLPTGSRGPNPLSRNEQINYRQTPPKSSHASSETSADTWRVDRPVRSGIFPRWATMPNDKDRSSSADLGGYGEATDDEIEWSDGASSDGIEISRRTTRRSGKGKGKEKEVRRTTRAEANVSDIVKIPKGGANQTLCWLIQLADVQKPKTYHGQLAHLDLSSSRSNSGSRDSRSMPSRREKRKRIDEFSSPSLKSTSTYELISPDSDEEEDDYGEDSESDYLGKKGARRGRGRAKNTREEEDIDTDEDWDSILYNHRSVSSDPLSFPEKS